ncbi:hypothetical protein [Bacillus sp. FJAT-45066]|uniref:hypothetical protein n=1 Tax=Bacillus sp. FJAT-45066 TaxID=2011010 RepID=UPI000BB81999|nr:hypothetical protein [Bacillus sp. FJAT-45066]
MKNNKMYARLFGSYLIIVFVICFSASYFIAESHSYFTERVTIQGEIAHEEDFGIELPLISEEDSVSAEDIEEVTSEEEEEPEAVEDDAENTEEAEEDEEETNKE